MFRSPPQCMRVCVGPEKTARRVLHLDSLIPGPFLLNHEWAYCDTTAFYAGECNEADSKLNDGEEHFDEVVEDAAFREILDDEQEERTTTSPGLG